MKTIPLAVLLSFVLFSPTAKGEIGYPHKDPSMARVLRLFNAECTWFNEARWKQHQEDLQTVGYQDFRAFKRFLEDADFPPYNNWSYQVLISYVSKIDGVNMCSTGHADMMRLTREFLAVKSENPDWQSAAYCLLYLSQKGNSDDLALLEKYAQLPSKLDYAKQSALESHRVLQARVAGSNLLSFLQTRYYCWSTNEPPFLPSVANTGPQAAYVYDLLKQALAKYGDATNIPSELVTMAVSFDADGTPVCSVDPAKYGLVMPDFPLPPPSAVTNEPTVFGPQQPATVSGKTGASHVTETPADLPVRRRVVGLLAVGAGLLAVFVLWCVHKNKT
ncbi:MAG: hypothetical protein BWX70_01524 [Verrucomicrobia bacterium ADurb.Bin070]|nr:MAG: hypothetical protein BWX70_01524 [Verrucomicrobia bacterium ADurb.Bin070]